MVPYRTVHLLSLSLSLSPFFALSLTMESPSSSVLGRFGSLEREGGTREEGECPPERILLNRLLGCGLLDLLSEEWLTVCLHINPHKGSFSPSSGSRCPDYLPESEQILRISGERKSLPCASNQAETKIGVFPILSLRNVYVF